MSTAYVLPMELMRSVRAEGPSQLDNLSGRSVRSEQAQALGRSVERRLAIANARILLSLLDEHMLSRRAG